MWLIWQNLRDVYQFIQQSLERATTYVINAHSPLRAIQDGGRGNYEEAEGLFFENRYKNQFAR